MTTSIGWEKAMNAVAKEDIGLQDWLKEIPPKHWSRSHFTGMTHVIFTVYIMYLRNTEINYVYCMQEGQSVTWS